MHPKELLTKAQEQVLHLIYLGKSNKEIGKLLELPMSTVTSRVQETCKMLGAENRAGAIRPGLRYGYLEPPPRAPAPTRMRKKRSSS